MTIFSKIIAGEIPCHKIAENDKFFAFLDINPLTKGHVLVIPKIEEDYLFDLSDDTLGEMMIFSKRIAKSLKNTMDCVRVGVAVIGLEVPHAHIHLIPINHESDMNFRNPKLKLDPSEMEQIASEICKDLKLMVNC